MSLSKTSDNLSSKGNSNDIKSSEKQNSLVVRIDQDSDDNLQALFDSVLNPGDSKRPLQVPFRMRKLPNSFFTPPSASPRSPVSHSRANSADSAYDAGSQPNVNQTSAAASVSTIPTAVASSQSSAISHASEQIVPNRLAICHSRAHSSPASLQQTYSIHSGNIGTDSVVGVRDGNSSGFSNNTGFSSIAGSAAGVIAIDRLSHCVGQDSTNNPMQNFHMKQRSYDVVSPIQLQNELGALPSGWEQAKTNDGQIYYLNHASKTTQWEDPRIQFKQRSIQEVLIPTGNSNKESVTLTDTLCPLPEGWEQAFTESGDVYFINHINRTTSWNDPRIPDFLQKSIKVPKTEMSWINARHIEKEQECFKQKLDQTTFTRHTTSLQMDPFLSGENHVRQESSDSGLSLSSNTFSVNNTEFISQIDDSMDCISENGSLNTLNGLDCPENLVSSLQLEDNICNEMFILNTSPNKTENLEWYKIN